MASNPYPQLVLFGDSLFQQSVIIQEGFSFQAALQTLFIRRLDVVNRGFSGYNSSHALKILPEIIQPPSATAPKIDYLLVLLGANDAVRPLPTTFQHVPIDKFKDNLKKIITHPNILAHKPKILLVTPPPLDQIRLAEVDLENGHAEPTRYAKISAEYSEKVREVARELPGVVLIDLWREIMDKAVSMTAGFDVNGPWLGTPECGESGGLGLLLPDGLHMNGDAYRVFYGAVLPHIGEQWAGLKPEDRDGYVFPDWRDLAPSPV